MNQMRVASRGFTLIELLVVIAIIGLLSSVVMSSLNSARAKARDARRLAEIRQVAIALELYRNTNGDYPSWTGGSTRENSCFTGGNASDAVAQWDAVLTPVVSAGALGGLPRDPRNNGVIGGANNPDYCYGYHRSANTSAFDSCVDKNTGTLLYPRDHEYLLYFSVENPNLVQYTLNWNGNANKPMNACLPGPRR